MPPTNIPRCDEGLKVENAFTQRTFVQELAKDKHAHVSLQLYLLFSFSFVFLETLALTSIKIELLSFNEEHFSNPLKISVIIKFYEFYE